ncbi:MAG: undecaprenyl/decaprenyl-phosphate alpha-N-acetylglucosaminyl 1-phosphate transferase [Treponema sp.]|uniref:MraY family glycosyltransferase n=1 Tax=Treponema sp. TaxID=166 RepID=UPI001B7A1E46|nr:MraY family glycosyltransferase [Treponema sp.]MBP5403176.1 undecaprenyl/decaprenyl-phosphate alpha-N-acetylglucosaminyl 1-phosphate transferase [Treponema sp.]MBR5934398.1 undecaprenyl/decaprenyl-phosphate alpha-N-acetylglucosaminyl 1-phosphate transferase [Treponema sp.]
MWWMVAFSFCTSVVVIPLIILMCRHFGWYDTTNERKIHKGNIPRLGGLGIIIAFTLSTVIYFTVSKSNSITHVLPIIIAGLIIFTVALLDDFLNLKAKLKLLFQIIATVIVLYFDFRFKKIFNFELPLWFSYTLSFFWIIGIINAFNLIDGLDGLCGGLSFLIISSLGIIFYSSDFNAKASAGVCFMMAAAVAGFLVYNKPQAKIFMGDGGSQLMGFMIAVLPLYNSSENFEYNKLLVMIVLVSIPALDTIAAMWRRTREHRNFMSADSRHIHHKLIALGFTKVQTLIFLLSIQVCLCLSAGLGMYLRHDKGSILLTAILVFMIFFYSSIHFIYYAVTKNNPVDITVLRNEQNSQKENK